MKLPSGRAAIELSSGTPELPGAVANSLKSLPRRMICDCRFVVNEIA